MTREDNVVAILTGLVKNNELLIQLLKDQQEKIDAMERACRTTTYLGASELLSGYRYDIVPEDGDLRADQGQVPGQDDTAAE